jgi:FkbM family methyltransferase
MSIFSILKYIINHPFNRKNRLMAVVRFLKWQINNRLNPYPIIYSLTDKAKLIINRGMTGATGNLYCGLHELGDMSFALHFLRKDDLFVDVGANIGSYTVLASAHVGARSISFEPAPVAFAHLRNNVAINSIHSQVKCHNMALGSKNGVVEFTSKLDTVNHVAVHHDKAEKIQIELTYLDDVLQGEMPQLIKIDVEGFESEVIKGATKTLSNDGLKAIIIELNGSGARYGYDEEEINHYLTSLGFYPYTYDPFKRKIEKLNGWGSHNTIYIRDEEFVQSRLITALPFKVLDWSL